MLQGKEPSVTTEDRRATEGGEGLAEVETKAPGGDRDRAIQVPVAGMEIIRNPPSLLTQTPTSSRNNPSPKSGRQSTA
jgi:hypothetical protein